MYVDFVMGNHVNYFDMLGFQGVGRGIPQHRPNSRHRDANPHLPASRSYLPRVDIPLAHDMVSETQEAFLTLDEIISQHMTNIEKTTPSSSAGVQPPTFGGGGTSIGGERPTSHVTQSKPHFSTSCGGPCYGPRPRHGQVRTLF